LTENINNNNRGGEGWGGKRKKKKKLYCELCCMLDDISNTLKSLNYRKI
jgi:hypothetical protein